MENVTLEKMIPEMPEIEVGGVRLVMRKVTLSDTAWLQRRYGDKLSDVFESGNITEICKVIYHQLDNDSKGRLPAIDLDEYDDDGNLSKIRVTGPERLMRECTDQDDVKKLVAVFGEAMGASQPDVKPGVESEKKSQAQL